MRSTPTRYKGAWRAPAARRPGWPPSTTARATTAPGRSATDKYKKHLRSSEQSARSGCNAECDCRGERGSNPSVTSLGAGVFFHRLGSEAQVVHKRAHDAAEDGQIADPLQRVLPELHQPRNVRIARQAVEFRGAAVLEHG